MPESGGVIPRRRLGAELRRLREKSGNKLDDIAREMLISTSKLSRLENGQGVPQKRDVRDLIKFYGVTDALAVRMMEWVEESRRKPDWEEYNVSLDSPRDYLSFELSAVEIHLYCARMIPSLLQSPEYADGLIRALNTAPPDDIDDLVKIRMHRKEAWQRDQDPAQLDIVLEESALLRTVGSTEIMNSQLRQVAELASSRPNITLRVLQLDVGPHWAIMEGTFTVFRFPDGVHPDVAKSEYVDKYYVDHEATFHYNDRYTALKNLALPPEESSEFILQVARDRYSH